MGEWSEVEALADEWGMLLADSKRVKPYVAGDTTDHYCGKACGKVGVTINPLNWNTPERLAAYCSTRSCSCSMKVSDLPKRYVVSQWELDAGAKRLLRRLRAEVARASALRLADSTDPMLRNP